MSDEGIDCRHDLADRLACSNQQQAILRAPESESAGSISETAAFDSTRFQVASIFSAASFIKSRADCLQRPRLPGGALLVTGGNSIRRSIPTDLGCLLVASRSFADFLREQLAVPRRADNDGGTMTA
jgi:hypothetical protein